MDPVVKPMHAPIHRQLIYKIKATHDTYKSTGQLVLAFEPTAWIWNKHVGLRMWPLTHTMPGKICICLDPSKTLNEAIQEQKYFISPLRRTYTSYI